MPLERVPKHAVGFVINPLTMSSSELTTIAMSADKDNGNTNGVSRVMVSPPPSIAHSHGKSDGKVSCNVCADLGEVANKPCRQLALAVAEPGTFRPPDTCQLAGVAFGDEVTPATQTRARYCDHWRLLT